MLEKLAEAVELLQRINFQSLACGTALWRYTIYHARNSCTIHPSSSLVRRVALKLFKST
jgi:hypothetical protein